MIGKKINQLATELAPVSTDLTIIGDPISGVSKKITLAQLGAIFSGAVSFYTNLAGFPATGDINVIYCAKDTQKLYLWSGSAYTEVFPSQALLDTYQLRSEKGVSNGYASLDSSGKVPISQLPSSIMEYKGTWNASTNTPTLANGTGDTGDVYICNVAGTVNFGAGPITFAVGDYVIYSGTIWQRSSGAVGTVTSVAASITGNAIGITGSPVTTSGTLAFAFAGTGAQYIKGDGTLATFPTTIAQAERLITEVYNSTGATLTKGTIVYINGGQGNLPTVTKALATGDSTSAQTFGVVQADITNNNNGYVVVAGKLSDLDTQAYTPGTQLYLSSTTAGTWTSTKQYAPAHLVYVGIVVRSHPTQGIVEIKIQNGYELDELHDVAAQNPDNNDILQYKTSTSLWTKVAGTTSNIAEGSNLYYTDARSRAALSFTAGSGAYNSTTGVITIPTNTNQLTNGAAYITLGSLSAGAGISYNNTTGVIASTITQYTDAMARASISGGTGISYNSTTGVITNTITQYTDAMARASISLTTTGTSGAATYNSTTGVLNVPQYAPDLSGYVPTSRTLTINGTAFDLSANRSWSVGTVTSVGLSSATSGVTIGSTPVTTSGTITLAIATASGSQQGLLSSTDWTTFNNKQNALTNPVTGTGTTNYLPKFTGTSTIGNSLVVDNGTNIGIGTTNPTAGRLQINVSDTTTAAHFQIVDGTTTLANAFVTNFRNANDGNGRYSLSSWQVQNAVGNDQNGFIGVQSVTGAGAYTPNIVFGQKTGASSYATKMTLDASGNLGLGVTPSAWNTVQPVFQIGYTAFSAYQNTQAIYSSNGVYTSGWKYLSNTNATYYSQNEAGPGIHAWFIAPSGTAGNAISFTQAMTLNASGNLSIGNTNDSFKLDVSGTGRFTGAVTISGHLNLQGAVTRNINFLDSSNTNINAQIQYDQISSNSGQLFFGTNNAGSFATRLTIASTGAATFSSSVTAASTLYLGNDGTYGSTYRTLGLTGTTNGTHRIFAGTGDNMYIAAATGRGIVFWTDGSSATKVSIDTNGATTFNTSATTALSVISSATASGLQLKNTGTTASDWIIQSDGGVVSGQAALRFYSITASAYRMSIDGSGNVGIGTTSPTGRLMLYQSTAGNVFQNIVSNQGGSTQVGINLSPSMTDGEVAANPAQASIYATDSNYGANIIFANKTTGAVGNSLTERMRITSGGLVGIGVTNPSEKLHLRDTTNGYTGLRLEGNGNYAGSDWTIYASSLSAPSSNDFLGFYNNSTTDSATAEYKFRLFKTGVAEFVGDVKVKTLEVTNATTYGSSGGISTYMQITVNGNNYVIPLHQTP